MICPDCKNDCNSLEIQSKSKQLCKENGINGELCNPGGRQLRFKSTGDKWLQISDHCYYCDLKEIEKFIKENKL